jgi:hypothetical protein
MANVEDIPFIVEDRRMLSRVAGDRSEFGGSVLSRRRQIEIRFRVAVRRGIVPTASHVPQVQRLNWMIPLCVCFLHRLQ